MDNETKMIRSELMLNYNLNQFDEEYLNKLDGLNSDETLQCDDVVVNSKLTSSQPDSNG